MFVGIRLLCCKFDISEQCRLKGDATKYTQNFNILANLCSEAEAGLMVYLKKIFLKNQQMT